MWPWGKRKELRMKDWTTNWSSEIHDPRPLLELTCSCVPLVWCLSASVIFSRICSIRKVASYGHKKREIWDRTVYLSDLDCWWSGVKIVINVMSTQTWCDNSEIYKGAETSLENPTFLPALDRCDPRDWSTQTDSDFTYGSHKKIDGRNKL